jgi:hypothetical protein
MASWLFTIMVIHWGWQLGICSAAGGTESITLLIQKYSDSTGLITIEQMQHILDRIHNCSSDSSNIDSANSARQNCASNEDCSYVNNVNSFIWHFVLQKKHIVKLH